MTVLRNRTQSNFTMISNAILHNKKLRLFDRGLLATIIGLPDNWDFSVEGLTKIVPDGRDAISRSIERLVDMRYLKRECIRDKRGRFDTVIEVFSEPYQKEDKPPERNYRYGKSDTVNLKRINRSGFTDTENQQQYNTVNTKSNINNKDDKSIYQSSDDEDDIETERQNNNTIIADNINLNCLLEKARSRGGNETKMVLEIYNLICEMVNYPRESVTIRGTAYDWIVVKNHFLKLNYDNVAAVLNRVIDSELKIKDMHKYLISSLFTETECGTISSQSQLHDGYLKYLRGCPY